MEISKEHFKKMFPNLAKEMNMGEQKVTINAMRSDEKTAEKTATARRNFSNYDPDVIDFLRRCDNEQQGEEIITYLEKRGEITHHYAQKLRQQLRKKGVRSFGPKKEEGYYLRQYR
ncbi:MAG: DUF2095 family protein [Candidatus Bathyarchaeia archaeon]